MLLEMYISSNDTLFQIKLRHVEKQYFNKIKAQGNSISVQLYIFIFIIFLLFAPKRKNMHYKNDCFPQGVKSG